MTGRWADRLGRLQPGSGDEGFALLHRPGATGRPEVELLTGTVHELTKLVEFADLVEAGDHPTVLGLVPFAQAHEVNLTCHRDGTPLLALAAHTVETLSLEDVGADLPDTAPTLSGISFDPDDREYEQVIRDVLRDEIAAGQGSNFVIKRTLRARVHDFSGAVALAIYRRLLRHERGTYWTFLVVTAETIIIGASPERHLSLADGLVTMNPISGTYRYPEHGPGLPEVLDFLRDRKEVDELHMVVDEELKMMARICGDGGQVRGPYLKEMANLAHTEYVLEGRTSLPIDELIRLTMFAPTVTGSPLSSACNVIHRHEPGGRGYYGGVAALVTRRPAGGTELDSAILIRTAQIAPSGDLEIGVGGTLVRHSDPAAEVAETRAKAAGLIAAMGSNDTVPAERAAWPSFAAHTEVRRLLAARASTLAPFWSRPARERSGDLRTLPGRRVLLIDAEDSFTAMMGHQLAAMRMAVTIQRYDAMADFDAYDLVVVGPGPGDPRGTADPRINALRSIVHRLLVSGKPLLAVCLGHQLLSGLLGLELVRRSVPNQGVQQQLHLLGHLRTLGFYNSFMARSDVGQIPVTGRAGAASVIRDRLTGEVHALIGPGFASMQFHPESVLSVDGATVLAELAWQVLHTEPAATSHQPRSRTRH